MIGTNRDLSAVRDTIGREILRLTALKRTGDLSLDIGIIDRRISSLSRQRVALCAAIVNRRVEASKDVVVFSHWANGNGALDSISAWPSCDRFEPSGAFVTPWWRRIER